MIDDSDLDKIVNKIESNRKEKNKKSDLITYSFLAGLLIGGLLFVAYASSQPSYTETQNTVNANSEIASIQDMSCSELKHFTPKFANPNYVVLEILQRCIN